MENKISITTDKISNQINDVCKKIYETGNNDLILSIHNLEDSWIELINLIYKPILDARQNNKR